MVFVIHWHESAMDLHVFPIPIPPPTSLSTRFLWVFPVHQAWALVSCIQPGLVICFTLDNIHVSMLSSRNIPPSWKADSLPLCAPGIIISCIFFNSGKKKSFPRPTSQESPEDVRNEWIQPLGEETTVNGGRGPRSGHMNVKVSERNFKPHPQPTLSTWPHLGPPTWLLQQNVTAISLLTETSSLFSKQWNTSPVLCDL